MLNKVVAQLIVLSLLMQSFATLADDSRQEVVPLKPMSSSSLFSLQLSNSELAIPTYLTNVGEYTCDAPWAGLEELTNLEKGLIVNCWENPPELGAEDNKRFAYEQKVCHCLNTSKHQAITDTMKSRVMLDNYQRFGEDEDSRLERNLEDLHEKMATYRNGLGFNAYSLAPDDDVLKFFDNGPVIDNYYAEGRRALEEHRASESSNSKSRGRSSRKSNIDGYKSLDQEEDSDKGGAAIVTGYHKLKSLRANASRGSKKDNAIDVESERQEHEAADKRLEAFFNNPPELNKSLFQPSKLDLENGQCRGPAEFLAKRRYPQYSLNNPIKENFVEANWNYKKLETRYLELISRRDPKTAKELNEIKGRMLFLSRNPMLKSLFSIDFDITGLQKRRKFSDEEMVGINDAFKMSTEELKKEKERAFNLVKDMMKGCSRNLTNSYIGTQDGKKRKECFDESADSRLNYDAGMKDIFSNPRIGILTKLESEKEVHAIADEFNKKQKVKTGVAYKGFDEFLGMDAFKTRDIKSCQKKHKSNLIECVHIYAEVCPLVSEAIDLRNKNNYDKVDDVFNDNIAELMKDNFNTDFSGPNANEDFRRYNEILCSKKRDLTDRKEDLSFFDWRKERCGTSTTGICGSDSVATDKLYKEFIEGVKSNKGDYVAAPPAISDVGSLLGGGGRVGYAGYRGAGGSRGNTRSSEISTTEVAKSVTAPIATPSGASAPIDENLNATTVENTVGPNMGMMPFMNPLFSQLPAEGEKLTEADKENIRTLAEEEVARDRKDLASARDTEEKTRLEERLKLMEGLLSQKSDNEKKYQDLLSQLNQRLVDKGNGSTQDATVAQQSSLKNMKRTPASSQVSQGFSDDEQTDRPRVQVPTFEQRTNTAGSSGQTTAGQASSFRSSSVAGAARSSTGAGTNSALLDAAIARGKASSDGAAIIIQDVDRSTATALESTANASQQIALSVPANVYAQFQSENVEVLRRYKDQILSKVDDDQPVRLVVKNGEQSLNVVVMKRNGTLVFMPPRVFSLKGLKQQLQSSTQSPLGM